MARAHIRGEVGEDVYEAVAIALESHHEAVSRIVGKLFADSDLVKTVAERHDKYKPVFMRVKFDKKNHVPYLGFSGHPYGLSFRDFEDAFQSPRDVAVATSIGRLHHFINVRDVDSFLHTVALAKSYLDSGGVSVKLSELKREVLRGLIMLHVADMVSGFVEHALLSGTAEPEVYDTESLAEIEPHLPVSIIVDFIQDYVIARVRLHGLAEMLQPTVMTGTVRLDLDYRVCEGLLKSNGRVFEEASCKTKLVQVIFTHKQFLLLRKLHKQGVV